MILTVYLPPSTKVQSVADTLAVLLGSDHGEVVQVHGNPAQCEITAGSWHASYDFEGDGGCRMMRLSPNPFWCCAAHQLVVLYGGTMVLQYGSDAIVHERKIPKCRRMPKRMKTTMLNAWRKRLAKLREE